MAELRSGTVTFLFTDIEGSTKLWEKNPEEMKAALAKHDSLLRSIFLMHNGQVVKTTGDGFHAVFTTATDAVQAPIHSQQAIQKDTWDGVTIKVRMGIHTGEAEIRENDYFGQTLNLASRIMSAGHGGQILLSETTMQVAQKHLPGNVSFLDLGQHYFKGLSKAEKVFQATSPDLEQDFPALKSLTYATNNLPAQLTSFIGREKEVEQIKKRLEKSRLVTLTGSGGVGKTRLSIQVASELLNEYPNGVWVVELAPITDPAFVARVICGVLDITLPSNASPLTVLTEYLHAKKLLLVMDNCEHLIETCAQICDSLLHTCPNLRIFASSREALGIDGENSYHVPSLSLPDPKSGLVAIEGTESVKLFMDRATAVLPEFELNQSNASSIAQICKRLDGIPLAIELAASRVKLLKVEQIASRLDDAFRLLTGGSRTALPRQQTLRALINWSYNLLSEQEKILFRRLAVFAGGWTMEAAEAVCSGDGIEPGDVLDLMANLVDKSLIVVTREGTESRYRRLETIRQYAREKLVESGKSETLRNRHMEYYCQLVEQFEPGLRGPDQVILMDSLEIELDNLRAAMEWALDHDVYAGLQLASGLHWLWQVRGRLSEGAGWLDRLLSMEVAPRSDSESDAVCRAEALLVFAFLTAVLGDRPKSTASVMQSMALCERMDDAIRAPLLANSYHLLGSEAISRNDINQARVQAEKSLELFQRSGNKFGIAEVQCTMLMVIAFRSDDLDTARRLSESTLAIREELGDKDGIAFELNNSGLVALGLGDYDQAIKSFKAAVEASRESRSDYNLSPALGNLAITYLFKGEMDLAREYILLGAKLAQEKWNPMHKANSIYWLAMYSFEQKQFRKFIQLNSYLETEKSHLSILYFLPQNIPATFQRNITAAQAQLDEDNLHSAEAEGKAMTLDQAFDYALEGIDE